MVGFGVELAFPVRADGGNGEDFSVPANHEKPLITKIAVNSVAGVFAGGPGIDRAFMAGGGSAGIIHRFATGSQTRCQ